MKCENCGGEIPENVGSCGMCKINEREENNKIIDDSGYIDNETAKINKKKFNKGIIVGLSLGFVVFCIFLYFLIWPRVENRIARKPIIYLYPVTETEVNVTLGSPQNLTHTYPKYNSGWNVIAEPSGKLIDKATGRTYYALYWEGIKKGKLDLSEGFVVKGKDTITFLEEKLSILGLNEREANEFIVYWLPELEKNPYNFIRFQTSDEINENMPLNISPMPESIIRVMMEYKKIDNYIEVKQQQLYTPQREGFTVVEWGGISH